MQQESKQPQSKQPLGEVFVGGGGEVLGVVRKGVQGCVVDFPRKA
jgi:hypothetical protein